MYTMVLSIMHRASGLYLSGCGFLFVAWIVSAALGPAAYACVSRFLSTLPMRIVLALALAAFWYHLFAGMRHLSWDAGYGFEKRSARRSGALVVVSRYLNPHFKVGIGYNFTDFSDDLTDLSFDHRGVFLSLTGAM